MRLGWIDFSKEERNKVLDVIHLLREQGAVDELGIGGIRDAFADYFFPGTSTIQTRAKYYLIVPYVLKEAVNANGVYDVASALKWIDEQERECGKILIQTSKDGVIGVNVLPNNWVARAPSAIYWNGIRTLGIFKDRDLSIAEYLHLALKQKQVKQDRNLGNRNDSLDEEKDDKDAGDANNFQFWSLGDTYRKNWREDLTVELLQNEAAFLRHQIVTERDGSFYAFLLKNNIAVDEYDSIAALTAALEDKLPKETLRMLEGEMSVSCWNGNQRFKVESCMMKKVAFICVHNSCRSQIAEALGKHLAADIFESYSAGTEIKPQINQDAVRIMKELYGIDMEKTQYSKLMKDIPEPDIAISMGCNVTCPFIGRDFDDNWQLEDPTGKSDEEFRKVIAEIEGNILRLKEKLC